MLCFSCAFVSLIVNATSTDDWIMFRHDLNRTGYSSSSAPATNSTLWNFKTVWLVSSSQAVVGGRLNIGADDGKVFCLDASTGSKIWNYTTGGAVFFSAAVIDGRVYVGSDDKVY